jgi:hypothetical protein
MAGEDGESEGAARESLRPRRLYGVEFPLALFGSHETLSGGGRRIRTIGPSRKVGIRFPQARYHVEQWCRFLAPMATRQLLPLLDYYRPFIRWHTLALKRPAVLPAEGLLTEAVLKHGRSCRTAALAPYPPFAIPIGIGSIGWKPAIRFLNLWHPVLPF